jgi:hypothetical protein
MSSWVLTSPLFVQMMGQIILLIQGIYVKRGKRVTKTKYSSKSSNLITNIRFYWFISIPIGTRSKRGRRTDLSWRSKSEAHQILQSSVLNIQHVDIQHEPSCPMAHLFNDARERAREFQDFSTIHRKPKIRKFNLIINKQKIIKKESVDHD